MLVESDEACANINSRNVLTQTPVSAFHVSWLVEQHFFFPQKARDKLKCHNLFIEKYPRVYIHFYTFFHSELTQAQILTLFSSHFVFI